MNDSHDHAADSDEQLKLASAPAGTGLVCPDCEYDLTGLEEHGVTQCPECGAGLDFRELRQWQERGQALGSNRQIIRQVLFHPRRFFAGIKSPRHYLQVPERDNRFIVLPSLLTGLAFVIAFLGLNFLGPQEGREDFDSDYVFGLVVTGPLISLLPLTVHFLAKIWFWMLLILSGRRRNYAGMRQMTYYAPISLWPLPLAPPLLAGGLLLIRTFQERLYYLPAGVCRQLQWWQMPRSMNTAGEALVALALVVVLLAIVHYSLVMSLGYRTLTRQHDDILWPLVFLNPILIGGVAFITIVWLASQAMPL